MHSRAWTNKLLYSWVPELRVGLIHVWGSICDSSTAKVAWGIVAELLRIAGMVKASQKTSVDRRSRLTISRLQAIFYWQRDCVARFSKSFACTLPLSVESATVGVTIRQKNIVSYNDRTSPSFTKFDVHFFLKL